MRLVLPLALLPLLACGSRTSEVPVTPKVEVGRATVSGRVVDLSNIPVPAMTVSCAESDDSFVTGDDGAFSLSVPADTALTLRVVAVDPLSVYKDTSFGPLQLSNKQSLEHLELLSVPGSTIGGLNGIASGDENRGVIALQVVSVTGKCISDDATVSVEGTATARAVYNLPGTSQPDRDLTKMQPGTRPQAWLAGVAPGSYYSVKFNKPGCDQLPYPVAYGHVSWLDGFRIQSKALTMVTVFIP